MENVTPKKDFKIFALIPAAGMGKRMGASINKQYLELCGIPIVARTISIFQNSPLIDHIYLIIPKEEIPYCYENIVKKYNLTKVVDIIAGGKERQNSVMNGLLAIQNIASDDDVVIIHDGVRPFVTEDMIKLSIDSAKHYDGALVAVPAKDTIKIVVDKTVVETPKREMLWQAQTPQSFRYSVIFTAYKNGESESFVATDDSSLVENYGGKVKIIEGSYSNIKITTPEDLNVAETFLEKIESSIGA